MQPTHTLDFPMRNVHPRQDDLYCLEGQDGGSVGRQQA
jgi:hypothetical protein